MFTGLIQELGSIRKIIPNEEGAKFEIVCPELIKEISIDDSIALNGCCLTAVTLSEDSFIAQAVHVTLEKTMIGTLKEGSQVNLELALRAGDRLGGHMVQGHVNSVCKITNIKQVGEYTVTEFSLPKDYRKYLISEGSVALNGVSLTVARLNDDNFSVSFIPHTLEKTTFGKAKVGDSINLEIDMIAKYVENFVKFS